MRNPTARAFTATYLGVCVVYGIAIGYSGYAGADPALRDVAWLLFLPHAILAGFLYTECRMRY